MIVCAFHKAAMADQDVAKQLEEARKLLDEQAKTIDQISANFSRDFDSSVNKLKKEVDDLKEKNAMLMRDSPSDTSLLEENIKLKKQVQELKDEQDETERIAKALVERMKVATEKAPSSSQVENGNNRAKTSQPTVTNPATEPPVQVQPIASTSHSTPAPTPVPAQPVRSASSVPAREPQPRTEPAPSELPKSSAPATQPSSISVKNETDADELVWGEEN